MKKHLLSWIMIPAVLATSACAVFGSHDRIGTQAPAFATGGLWISHGPHRAPPLIEGRPAGWTLYAFFGPTGKASIAEVPELVRLQKDFGSDEFRVVGLTKVGVVDAEQFASTWRASYPIYAVARNQFDALEITELPDSYLVGPEGIIVAEGLRDSRRRLQEEFPRDLTP